MRRFPGLGLLLAQGLAKYSRSSGCASSESERAAPVAVDGDELGVGEARQHDVALRFAQRD